MEIGEKIKFLRLQNHLTQEELGDRCELTKGYISMILNCKKKPPGARERLEAAFERIIERRSA